MLKWSFNACLRIVHMFVIKRPTKYGFCALFARPLSSFLEGLRSLAPVIFLDLIFSKIMSLALMMLT